MDPIIKFNTQLEATDLAKEWAERIGLTGWCLSIVINVPAEEIGRYGTWGANEADFVKREAVIKISEPSEGELLSKYCAEFVLIRELLFIRFPNILDTRTPYGKTGKLLYMKLINQMARALLSAKCDLDAGWFYNTGKEESAYFKFENDEERRRVFVR